MICIVEVLSGIYLVWLGISGPAVGISPLRHLVSGIDEVPSNKNERIFPNLVNKERMTVTKTKDASL